MKMSKKEYRDRPYIVRCGDRMKVVYRSEGGARRWLLIDPADAFEAMDAGRGGFEEYLLGQAFAGEGEHVSEMLRGYSLTRSAIRRAWGQGRKPSKKRVWLTPKKGGWGGAREKARWPEELTRWWDVYVGKAAESRCLGFYATFEEAYEELMGRAAPEGAFREFCKEVLAKQQKKRI